MAPQLEDEEDEEEEEVDWLLLEDELDEEELDELGDEEVELA